MYFSQLCFASSQLIVAFPKACYTKRETYTPNLIFLGGASGDQVEREQTARSPVKYIDAEPKYPPDRHSTAKEANTRKKKKKKKKKTPKNNNSLLLGEGVSRSPSPWFQSVQASYPSLRPSRYKMLHSPSSTRLPPPPTQGKDFQWRWEHQLRYPPFPLDPGQKNCTSRIPGHSLPPPPRAIQLAPFCSQPSAQPSCTPPAPPARPPEQAPASCLSLSVGLPDSGRTPQANSD